MEAQVGGPKAQPRPPPPRRSDGRTVGGQRALYNEWAPSYDEDVLSWDYTPPSRVAQVARAFVSAGMSANRTPGIDEEATGQQPVETTVLDLGCGTGLCGHHLLEAGLGKAGIVGVDISEVSLQLAMQKGTYTSTVVADLNKALPLADGGFDVVISAQVFTALAEFGQLFSEVCRLTRPGGVFVFTIRTDVWDPDDRGCRSFAEKKVEEGAWEELMVGDPELYMPLCPDPVESQRQTRIIAYRCTGKPLMVVDPS